MSKSERRRSGASEPKTPSRSPGRRDRGSSAGQSFFERYRTLILGGVVVAAIVVVGVFIFAGATSPTYACSTEWQPGGAQDPERLGAPQDDMGRGHVQAGEAVTYTFCPPASGDHVNRAGQGPIDARLYAPDDQAPPQGWIHNLEHGGMVVLYRCGDGPCDEADQDALRDMLASFPLSPVCGLPAGVQGPVIARFDDMPHDFAGLLWGRVLYQDQLDTDEMLRFFETEGERGAPEPQCAPSPSPNASPSPG